MGSGKGSISCKGKVYACAYTCMSLHEADRSNRSERLCSGMFLRGYDCMRLGVRNFECVRSIE